MVPGAWDASDNAYARRRTYGAVQEIVSAHIASASGTCACVRAMAMARMRAVCASERLMERGGT
jgi:hypothetical protein